MNERIRELREQVIEWVPNQVDPDTKIRLLNADRFAELIVRECAKSLWTEECHSSDLALEEFERNSAKIKQHFGVEE
jgi:hypothetical protein